MAQRPCSYPKVRISSWIFPCYFQGVCSHQTQKTWPLAGSWKTAFLGMTSFQEMYLSASTWLLLKKKSHKQTWEIGFGRRYNFPKFSFGVTFFRETFRCFFCWNGMTNSRTFPTVGAVKLTTNDGPNPIGLRIGPWGDLWHERSIFWWFLPCRQNETARDHMGYLGSAGRRGRGKGLKKVMSFFFCWIKL